MEIIKGFAAVGNRLTGPMPIVPTGNVASVGLHFMLSDEWDDLTVEMTIHKGEYVWQQTVGENGIAVIPSGALASRGTFDVGLAGYVKDGDEVTLRISTNRVSGRIVDGAYISGMVPGPAHDDPTDWERMLDHLDDHTNPHEVTAEQTGALPTTGGEMSGAINMSGSKITGLGTPTANGDAATKQYVDEHGGTVETDTEMSDTSENAVQNKVIKEYVDSHVPTIEYDAAMSDTSENGVQNKVIKAYADTKLSMESGGSVAGDISLVFGAKIVGADLEIDGSDGTISANGADLLGVSALSGSFGSAIVTNVGDDESAVVNKAYITSLFGHSTHTYTLADGTTVTEDVVVWQS